MDIFIVLRNGMPIGVAYKDKGIAQARVYRYNLEAENDSIYVKYTLKVMHVI